MRGMAVNQDQESTQGRTGLHTYTLLHTSPDVRDKITTPANHHNSNNEQELRATSQIQDIWFL